MPRDGRSDNEVAKAVGQFLLAEFGRQDGFLTNVRRAPEQQQKNWQAEDAVPRGIDREVVTGIHSTHVGGDDDAEHILMAAARTALADGWGGSMIATDVSDILFGEPKPLRSRVNLGVLKADEVNIIVHGHEPTLSDVLVAAAPDPELLAEARAKGAKGINLAGICCTANEILMRHGIPVAGNFLQQELADPDRGGRRDAGGHPVRLSGRDRVAEVLPHEGDLDQRQGQVSQHASPGVPRVARDGNRQGDRAHRHRELSPIAIRPR